MRLINADDLEKEGWSLHRTIRVDKNTSEYQTKPLASIPTVELCEDTVSRQMAIDAINKLHDKPNAWLDYAVEAVKELPSVQQWIPCSERLPEANGRYLVTRGLNACGTMWNRVYLINYSDLMGLKSERIWWNGNVGKSDFEHIDDVLAWMPLPEPYKEES